MLLLIPTVMLCIETPADFHVSAGLVRQGLCLRSGLSQKRKHWMRKTLRELLGKSKLWIFISNQTTDYGKEMDLRILLIIR